MIRAEALCCFIHILDLKRIRPMLDLKTASTIATFIVHAKLDYCNSLFLNIDIPQINLFQAIQNALARAVTKTPQNHHIGPVLKNSTGSKYQNESNTKQYHSPITHFNPHFSPLRPPISVSCSRSNLFALTLLRPSVTSSLKICWSLSSRSCPASLEQTSTNIATTIWSITKTASLAISPQLFHSKLKALLFNKSYPDKSWFVLFSIPLFPSQTSSTIAVWLSACLTLWIWLDAYRFRFR